MPVQICPSIITKERSNDGTISLLSLDRHCTNHSRVVQRLLVVTKNKSIIQGYFCHLQIPARFAACSSQVLQLRELRGRNNQSSCFQVSVLKNARRNLPAEQPFFHFAAFSKRNVVTFILIQKSPRWGVPSVVPDGCLLFFIRIGKRLINELEESTVARKHNVSASAYQKSSTTMSPEEQQPERDADVEQLLGMYCT